MKKQKYRSAFLSSHNSKCQQLQNDCTTKKQRKTRNHNEQQQAQLLFKELRLKKVRIQTLTHAFISPSRRHFNMHVLTEQFFGRYLLYVLSANNMIFRINLVQAFSATLALTSFLAKGTKATSLRGQADQGEDLRHLQLIAPEEDVDLEPGVIAYTHSNFIEHTTGGCMGRNELGSIKNFEVDPKPNGHATTNFGDDYDFGKKNHYTMADCVEMCDSHDECVSIEYSKTAGSNGKTCSLSTTCDSYRKTVKSENSSNFFFLKRTPVTEAALPCYYDPITVSGEQFKQLVSKCINIGEAELLEGWDTSAVTNMVEAFEDQSEFNIDISKWNTAAVTDMTFMFDDASEFDQDISNWNTAKVINMAYMFRHASKFNQDIGNWNTAKVKNMNNMFAHATEFNQDIGDWNTVEVRWMNAMFYHAEKFNQDISNWNTAKVKDMNNMFFEAYKFNRDISAWDTSKVAINLKWLKAKV